MSKTAASEVYETAVVAAAGRTWACLVSARATRNLHVSFSLISWPSWTGTSSLRTVRWDVNYAPTCKGRLQVLDAVQGSSVPLRDMKRLENEGPEASLRSSP